MIWLKNLPVIMAATLCVFMFSSQVSALPADTDKPASERLEMVNINTADARTLAKMLKGVGEKRAAAIIHYREKNGPFTDAYQLQQIKGINEGIVNRNLSKIQL